jgi:hypothetical protein
VQAALAPVVMMAKTVLDQLAAVRAPEIQVELGVELTAEAGAVIARAEGTCHLTVTLTWGSSQANPSAADTVAGADAT